MLSWLPVFAVVGAAVYWHLTRTFTYWRDRGVRHLTPTILFGNLKDRMLFRVSFHQFQLDLYREFTGQKVAGFYEGRRPTLMIRDPDLIRDVMVRHFDSFTDRPSLRTRSKPYEQNMLLNLKGQHWKKVRAILTPTFSTGKLRMMETLVLINGEQLKDYLNGIVQPSTKVTVEMKELFGRFTMDVIASCAFGVQCNSLKQPKAPFASTAARFNDISIARRFLIFAVIFLIPPALHKFIPLSFMNTQVTDFLVSIVQETKDARKKHGGRKHNDFLQLMIDTANKEARDGNDKVLDDDTIKAQALLILLAGFETSSTLLTCACYELALNPDIQEKAREEIASVLSRHDDKCTYEALQDMNYLENVLLEALRKYPPVARLDRVCTEDYTVQLAPNHKVTVEKGNSVSVPVIGLHYDSEFYPDPQKFDPDRFLPKNRATRSPYVFLPFGEGPRNCIGKRFALLTTKIAMVYLLKDFIVETSSRTSIPFEYSKFSMLLKSKDGIWLNIARVD